MGLQQGSKQQGHFPREWKSTAESQILASVRSTELTEDCEENERC